MNPILHHMWNSERDGTRESGRDGVEITKQLQQLNKTLLKQNRGTKNVG